MTDAEDELDEDLGSAPAADGEKNRMLRRRADRIK